MPDQHWISGADTLLLSKKNSLDTFSTLVSVVKDL